MRIGSAITLLAIGAILAFAVDIDPTPLAGLTIRWDTVGVILMLVGVLGLVWSIVAMNSLRRRDAVVTHVEQPTVVERDTWVR